MKNILLFFLSFVFTLFLIEVFLQVSEVSSLSVTKNDELLGSSLKPNSNLILFNEGFYIGKVNKYGYYGPDYPPDKDNNIVRIALIGDSYVESHQLFDRNSLRKMLEDELQTKINKKVEVLNFGMSGFNLNDDYCYYENFVKRFNPDIVLFFVSDEDFKSVRTSNRRPYCYLDKDSLKISYDFRKNKSYIFRKKTAWFRGKSIILGWIFKVHELISKGFACEILLDKFCRKKQETKENRENKNINFNLTKVEKKIIKKIISEKNIYFVEKEPLNEKIFNFLQTNKAKVIKLNKVDNPKYHFWKVTKKYGHWNYQAHKLIAKQLSDYIYKIVK